MCVQLFLDDDLIVDQEDDWMVVLLTKNEAKKFVENGWYVEGES